MDVNIKHSSSVKGLYVKFCERTLESILDEFGIHGTITSGFPCADADRYLRFSSSNGICNAAALLYAARQSEPSNVLTLLLNNYKLVGPSDLIPPSDNFNNPNILPLYGASDGARCAVVSLYPINDDLNRLNDKSLLGGLNPSKRVLRNMLFKAVIYHEVGHNLHAAAGNPDSHCNGVCVMRKDLLLANTIMRRGSDVSDPIVYCPNCVRDISRYARTLP